METKELTLKNYNNCLACEAFIQIHFEPTRPLTDADLETVFHVKQEEMESYVRLVDILRFYFKDVPGIATLPATGMEAPEWRAWWLTQYPNTEPETMMCVYYYKKQLSQENPTTKLKGYKGFIPIAIPTKKYIKAYIISRLGEQPLMNRENKYGRQLFTILQSKRNNKKAEFSKIRYNTYLKIYIPIDTHRRRGCNLNETNIKDFNRHIDDEIKEKFYLLMDYYTELLPSFESNLPQIRKILGIDLEAWSDDSMKKVYYRYRKSTGKRLFYNDIIGRNVPSKHNHDFAF